jgi:hypothetical protein
MKRIMLCTIVVLTSAAASLPAYGENPYIGYWALTLPNGGPGWLGVTQEKGDLEASILWGGGSVKPVNSSKVEGDQLVITRVQVERRGANKGKKITENSLPSKPDPTAGSSAGQSSPANGFRPCPRSRICPKPSMANPSPCLTARVWTVGN